jgi:hypothetical protein
VGIEVEKRLLLARHRFDQAAEHDVLADVGKVARVKVMSVVHRAPP